MNASGSHAAPGGSTSEPICARLGFALGFTQAGDAIAVFPLAAFFEHLDAFKAFENVSFAAQSGSGPQTPML